MKVEDFARDMPVLMDGVLRIPGEPMVALLDEESKMYHVGLECLLPHPFNPGLWRVVACVGIVSVDVVYDCLRLNAEYRREQAAETLKKE